MTYINPLDLSPEQRRSNLAALNDRMARVSARVAADSMQTKATRAVNARNAATARRIARDLKANT